MSSSSAIKAEIGLAKRLYEHRRARDNHFAYLKFNEPGWDMLLFLFINQSRPVTVGELCDAGNVPRTTSLRYAAQLSENGLISKVASADDARIQYVRLSDRAVTAMRSYLKESVTGADPVNRS